MKTGLFFGSFNPIHVGHLIIANHFLEFTDLDTIWFIVSPHNPLKDKNSLLPADTRLKMVRAAIKDNKRFEASDVEFYLPQPSYTIDTLRFLRKKYPWMDFVLLMGSDSYASLADWKEYYNIIADYPIYIYQRRDLPVKKKSTEKEKNIHLFEFPYLDISATYIRGLMEQGKSVRYLVPDKALKFFRE